MLPGYPESAICVQRFDDSLNSAIHTTYRNWLRSSSMHEPRDPPSEVVTFFSCCCFAWRPAPPRPAPPRRAPPERRRAREEAREREREEEESRARQAHTHTGYILHTTSAIKEHFTGVLHKRGRPPIEVVVGHSKPDDDKHTHIYIEIYIHIYALLLPRLLGTVHSGVCCLLSKDRQTR